MSVIDFNYSVDVESTDKQGGGGVLPVGYYRVWAEAIDFPETKDKKGRQAALTFEIQEPEQFRGRKWWEYWVMLHGEEFKNGQYKFGKPRFDRFCRAVQVLVEKGTDSDELLFKSFVVKLGISEGGIKDAATGEKYKDKNQIEHFYYEDDQAKEPVPELGVIGDGTMPAAATKPAANDNKATTTTAAPAAAKKTPWGKPKAA